MQKVEVHDHPLWHQELSHEEVARLARSAAPSMRRSRNERAIAGGMQMNGVLGLQFAWTAAYRSLPCRIRISISID
jgi:hypothetical protein